MLSNPPPPVGNSFHSRQRQHRRQNSTPSAFEVVKIAPHPSYLNQHSRHQQQQRASAISHRRGLSLDTQRQRLSPTTARTTTGQDFTTVSTSTATTPTNRTGLAKKPQHLNLLREAQQQQQQQQQQRITRSAIGPNPGQVAGGSSGSGGGGGDGNNEFLLSPHRPHRRFVDPLVSHPCHQGNVQEMGAPFESYLGAGTTTINGIVEKNRANFAALGNGLADEGSGRSSGHNRAAPCGQDEIDIFAADSTQSTPTFASFPDSSPIGSAQQGWVSEGETAGTHSRRSSRRISNGIMDRVSKFEHLGNGLDNLSLQRPVTPPQQNGNNYLPPTPMETPHDRMIGQEPGRPARFADDYDESMEETLKPARSNRSSQRSAGIFQDLRREAEGLAQTPQRPRAMPMGYQTSMMPTPDYMSMANLNAEFGNIEQTFGDLPRHGSLDMTPDLCQPQPVSPMTRQHLMGFNMGAPFDAEADFHAAGQGSQGGALFAPGSSQVSAASSPSRRNMHRRTESIASVASAASISSINIEETKTDTGVTLDDIASFIDGPDPRDGKWVCLYESCGKKFGRKENIKSHVQTHLNDRQYQCPHCHKCFVRQHDLKRHAKIHTGIKPYPCECGNSFARHDALTRHRQRGMCVGAFDGVVRKVVKRGRPPKNRPGMEERREKRERTRRKNKASAASATTAADMTTSPSSGSSQSGYSDSSAANSPGNEFDAMLDGDANAFSNVMGMGSMDLPTSATMNPNELAVSSAPMPAMGDSMNMDMDMAEVLGVVSPAQIHSPSATSSYSHASHISHASIGGDGNPAESHDTDHDLPTHPGSPAKSIASHYTHQPGTPPELTTSSSSPPTTAATSRFFNPDPNSSDTSNLTSSFGTVPTTCGAGSGGGGASGMSGMTLDEEMFLFASEGGLVQLDRDMMMGGKFDDEYDPVTMFTNNDDVFFGGA